MEGRGFTGRLATYPGGGYWRELSDNKRESKKMIKDLFVSGRNNMFSLTQIRAYLTDDLHIYTFFKISSKFPF